MPSGDLSSRDGSAWDDPAARRAGAVLEIDLAAVRENYRRLSARLAPAACAAVVKADAYGLGAARVAPALAEAGADTFFVAKLDEAITLRGVLSGTIYVLNGLAPGTEDDFLAHGLRPVLNSLDEIARWSRAAAARDRRLEAALHLDTGMNRLGLPAAELARLAAEPERLGGISTALVMSHLACAEARGNPMNEDQRRAFELARGGLPQAPASLANSSGIFLGAGYHFDLARPGVALYGVNPLPGDINPMRQVVSLKAKILQVREIDAPQTVGYGASHRVAGPTRVATIGVGYADGYLRALSNRGSAYVGGREVAVVGRVSMDLITLDVTSVPPERAQPGAVVDLLDPETGLDGLAETAGTIGYEMLTALGRRYHRDYREA